MGTNIDKKMPKKLVWDIISKHKLSNLQKKILSDFFKAGPSTRADLNKKLGKTMRGKSYNTNLDKLVELNLLRHEQSFKGTNRKYSFSETIKDPKLRKAIKEADRKDDWARPRGFSKKKWELAEFEFRVINYNEPLKNKIGESLYSLTVWGVIVHLRNENKLPPRQVVFFAEKSDVKKQDSHPRVTNNDLKKVLSHFRRYFGLIARKWDYLSKNNDSELVYEKLFHTLLLANYYYEIMNADFEFEKSAVDDIKMSFFIPYTLLPKYAEKWMASIVKDNEIYDYLSDCFTDLQKNYTTNLEIVTEYKKTLDSFRKGKPKKTTKFFKKEDFIVKVPTNRKGYISRSWYIGKGLWGYHISNFLNVLDYGELNYYSQMGMSYPWHQKKRGKNSLKKFMRIKETI